MLKCYFCKWVGMYCIKGECYFNFSLKPLYRYIRSKLYGEKELTQLLNNNLELLKFLYSQEEVRTEELAIIFNCNRRTIHSRIYKLKISRPSGLVYCISKDTLIHLYLKKLLSLSQIARKFNCSFGCILKKFKKFNIKRRTKAEGLKGRKFSKKWKEKISKSRMGTVVSEKTRKKQSLSRGGTGIPYENNEYGDQFTIKLRNYIRKRDNYICQNPECNCTQKENGRALDVHHIDYNKENCKEYNLISLCENCHKKTYGNRDYWFAYYKYILKEKNYQKRIYNTHPRPI